MYVCISFKAQIFKLKGDPSISNVSTFTANCILEKDCDPRPNREFKAYAYIKRSCFGAVLAINIICSIKYPFVRHMLLKCRTLCRTCTLLLKHKCGPAPFSSHLYEKRNAWVECP